MACKDRRARCGPAETPVTQEPLKDIASVILMIAAIIGGLITAGKVIGAIKVVGGIIYIGGIALASAEAGGLISGTAAGVAIIILVAVYSFNRCKPAEGPGECISGVVTAVVQDFSDTVQEVFPFTAMHDRVDVVVRSAYWDIVESGGAFVHCTDEADPRKSEIMRCYYFTDRVCNAITGAQVGAGVGAIAGLFAAAAAAAAIGCSTIILCILALLVAAIIAAVAALIGAFAGGQIGKAASGDTSPTPTKSNQAIQVGDLITVKGTMLRRAYDDDANVMWWVTTSLLSGRAPATIPNNPYSYCEIDEIFTWDQCQFIIIG